MKLHDVKLCGKSIKLKIINVVDPNIIEELVLILDCNGKIISPTSL
jgi:hypothetical protein